jgi:hypothetical protein
MANTGGSKGRSSQMPFDGWPCGVPEAISASVATATTPPSEPRRSDRRVGPSPLVFAYRES